MSAADQEAAASNFSTASASLVIGHIHRALSFAPRQRPDGVELLDSVEQEQPGVDRDDVVTGTDWVPGSELRVCSSG
jgi:hypothetical protein